MKPCLLILLAVAVFSLYLVFLLTNFTDKIPKYGPSSQEMRIYMEPVSNKEILRKFSDKINCTRSSRMSFSFQYQISRVQDRYLRMREPGALARATYSILSLNVVCSGRDSVALFSGTGRARQKTISSHLNIGIFQLNFD